MQLRFILLNLFITKKLNLIPLKLLKKLGTEAELRNKLNCKDPYEWAKNYLKELNEKEKNKQEKSYYRLRSLSF